MATINQQIRPHGLVLRLAGMSILVMVLSAIAIWVGIDVSSKVANKAESLVSSHVPELRIISDLLDDMNQQIIALHNNYAEATEVDRQQHVLLRSRFTANLTELNRLGQARFDIYTLTQALDEFDRGMYDFDGEMKLGIDRDWDKLREHLAVAQLASNKVVSILSDWNAQIQARAESGGSTTLHEVRRLSHLQTGFILGVLGVSLIILLASYSRYKAQRKIFHQAYFDDLTNLPNRKYLEDNWESHARGINGSGSRALLLIRLDSFQTVTGIYGYTVGDQLLSSVSKWMEHRLAQHHERNRLFQYAPGVWLALILTDDRKMSAENIANDLLALSSSPRNINNRELNISCSIGIVHFSEDNNSLEGLLRNADKALRAARQLGGNNARVFQQEMNVMADNRLSIENGIRRAIRDSNFELYFQPKVRSHDGKVIGAEALIRWYNNGQLVSPEQFIPIAEQSALIIDIGDWVLANACQQWVNWQQHGQPDLHVAVNISAQQFQMPDFPEKVQQVLKQTGMPPQFLELEITEEVAAGSPEKVAEIMGHLKTIGVTLTLDDFGTGYSSLSNLKRFPLDTVKIDKMFVHQMETSAQDMAIVHMIHTLARELELNVVAEGVETDDQRQILTQMGSDHLQGYYFSKPLSRDDFIRFLPDNPVRLVASSRVPARHAH